MGVSEKVFQSDYPGSKNSRFKTDFPKTDPQREYETLKRTCDMQNWRRETFALNPLMVVGRRRELKKKRKIGKQGALREEEKNGWKSLHLRLLREKEEERIGWGFLKNGRCRIQVLITRPMALKTILGDPC